MTSAMGVLNPGAFGAILGFLDSNDPTPLWKQVDDNYAHGGGWAEFEGFQVTQGSPTVPYIIQYPGDPPHEELGRIVRRPEIMVIFDYSWVLWENTDTGQRKIARID